jgi:NADH:ubiquinone oxidoreductase subunit 6 (subunit J)
MIEILFLIAATVTLVSAMMTVTSHNVVHALLYLVVTMLAIALIFFLLGSSFAAALQIIVYAGAIMVLFIFVTMMLHQGQKSLDEEHLLFSFKGSAGAFILSAVLFIELVFTLSTFTLSVPSILVDAKPPYLKRFNLIKCKMPRIPHRSLHHDPYSLVVVSEPRFICHRYFWCDSPAQPAIYLGLIGDHAKCRGTAICRRVEFSW